MNEKEIKVQFTPVAVNIDYSAVKATAVYELPLEEGQHQPKKLFDESFGKAYREKDGDEHLDIAEDRAREKVIKLILSKAP